MRVTADKIDKSGIKFVKYIEFRGNRYYDNDILEVLYEDGCIQKGYLSINNNCITIHPIPKHKHDLSFYITNYSRIKSIDYIEN